MTSPIRRLLRELPPHRRGLGGGGGPPGAWDTSNSSPPAPPPSSVVSSVPGPPARVPTYPRHRRGAAPSRGSTDVTNAAARRGAPARLARPARRTGRAGKEIRPSHLGRVRFGGRRAGRRHECVQLLLHAARRPEPRDGFLPDVAPLHARAAGERGGCMSSMEETFQRSKPGTGAAPLS